MAILSQSSLGWSCELDDNYELKASSPYTLSVLNQLMLARIAPADSTTIAAAESTLLPHKNILHALQEIEPHLINCGERIEALIDELRMIDVRYQETASIAADIKVTPGRNLSVQEGLQLQKAIDNIRNKTPAVREKLVTPKFVELRVHQQKSPKSKTVVYRSSSANKISFDIYLSQVELTNLESIFAFTKMLNNLRGELPLRFRRRFSPEALVKLTSMLDPITLRAMRNVTTKLMILVAVIGSLLTVYRWKLVK